MPPRTSEGPGPRLLGPRSDAGEGPPRAPDLRRSRSQEKPHPGLLRRKRLGRHSRQTRPDRAGNRRSLLRIRRTDRQEAQGRPEHQRVGRVVLVPLHARLRVRRRNQANLELHRLQIVVGSSRKPPSPPCTARARKPPTGTAPATLFSDCNRSVLADAAELDIPLATTGPDHASLVHGGCSFSMMAQSFAIKVLPVAAGRGIHSIGRALKHISHGGSVLKADYPRRGSF